MKTPGIPIVVTVVLAFIIALSVFSSSLAIAGNGLEDYMGASWGGRNLGLAVVAALAIWWKSPAVYMAAFAGSIARDVGDIIEQLRADETAWPIVVFAGVLIMAWAVGLSAANRLRLATERGYATP